MEYELKSCEYGSLPGKGMALTDVDSELIVTMSGDCLHLIQTLEMK